MIRNVVDDDNHESSVIIIYDRMGLQIVGDDLLHWSIAPVDEVDVI